jgi:hypothetical protein
VFVHSQRENAAWTNRDEIRAGVADEFLPVEELPIDA